MKVQNRIASISNSANEKVVTYECGGQEVKLSPNIIRGFLVNGNGNVTDQEVTMFLNLCRYQHLNPFLREAYLIKFGNQPATIVVGKDAITKRAMRNPNFEGYQAGVVVWDRKNGDISYRAGSLVLKEEDLVGGWAKVYVKGYQHPIEAVVSYAEYVGITSDGKVNSQWARKPATMIRKVALVQALREAFPEDLSGLYASEEMGVDFDEKENAAPIDIEQADLPAGDPAEDQTAEDRVPEFDELPGF